MAERELIAIEWYHTEATTIRLIFASSPIERISGDRVMAAEMARAEGFIHVEAAPIHVGRWVKNPHALHDANE